MTDPSRLVVLHLDTERGWRGGQRQVLWLARSLAGRGHVSIVAARPGEPLARHAVDAGLTVVPCSPAFEFDPVAVMQLRAAILRRGVRIVHAHTGHAVALAALATLGTHAKTVVTRRVDFKLRSNFGSRWIYGRAHAIIAISRAVSDGLVASGISEDRVQIVPSGIDLTRVFAPAAPETLAQLGVAAGQPVIVQVAQLSGHKDPVTFVRAMAEVRKHVPNARALMVGDGPLRPAVEAEAERLGLTDMLRLTGYRTDADSLLAAADVATLSSRLEGLGTVLLDAMSMGKPIAATAGGGIPETVQHGVSGLLSPPGDPAKLGANIAAILQDPALAGRLSTGARRRAEDFSVERTAELTLKVYRRVLQQS